MIISGWFLNSDIRRNGWMYWCQSTCIFHSLRNFSSSRTTTTLYQLQRLCCNEWYVMGDLRLHGGEDSSRALPGYDAVWCRGRIPTFQTSMLPPSSLHPDDVGSMNFRNVSILPQHCTASQPRRPRTVRLKRQESKRLGQFWGCIPALVVWKFSACKWPVD